jgi:hypothetical protein
MEGARARVEYRLSAPTPPYLFSGIGEAEFSKKMQSLINTNGPHSAAKWLLDQDRRTSEIQIEHQTQTVAG